MEGYKATVTFASKELTAREKIILKDTSDAISLDEVTQQGEGAFIIKPDYYATIAVHNEMSENKDYTKYVVVDESGNKYVTGSQSFWEAFSDICDEMADAGETDFEVKIYRLESKNYKGKSFITCSLC